MNGWRRWTALGLLVFTVVGCASAAGTVAVPSIEPGSPEAPAPPAGAVAVVDTATPPPTNISPSPTLAPGSTELPSPTPSGSDGQVQADPRTLMMDSLNSTITGDARAVQDMGLSGNVSYIPVLTEFLRFPDWVQISTRREILNALARLVGKESGELAEEQFFWGWWVRWIGEHPEIRPPEGFAGFKGRLLSNLVDPAMEGFIHSGVESRIRLEEVVWGGVKKDGIPDLTNPRLLTPEQATYLLPSDRVFGVSINGEHRAYPLRVLNAHEMANDVLGGVPFALAY